jgi:hypothetical protein
MHNMRRIARRGAIGLGLALWLAGAAASSCSLDAGLGGLTGGKTGNPDGGMDATLGPDAPDSGGGGPSDSFVPGDSLTEAEGSAPPMDAQTFCAANPGHSLCDDFDEPGFRDVWNQGLTLTDGATLGQDPDAYTSPPYSLGVVKPTTQTAQTAFLTEKFTDQPNEIDMSFDLWIVEAGNTGAAIAELVISNGQIFAVVLKGLNPITFEISQSVHGPDGGIEYGDVPNVTFSLATGRWYHVALTFLLVGINGDGMVSAGVGDAGSLSGIPVFAPSAPPGTTFDLRAGLADYASTPFGSWTVRLDNFVADTK